MKKKYEKEYHLKKHDYLYNNQEYYLARAIVAKEEYFIGIVKIEDKILEFGCGLGQNIYLIRGAVGYDISKFALDFCKEKGVNVVKNLKGIKNGSFDVVLCCEVLEHLENPLKELKIMKSKLKEKGKLILTVPITKWKRPKLKDLNQELYCWDYQTVTNLLIRAGFYPIDYKILRRTGFKKWLFLYKANFFHLYLFFTWLSAIIFGSKHMRIIAVKK